MRIVATSDLHGDLPDIPPCDLLIVAGDICPTTDHQPGFQAAWLESDFRRWLARAPAREIVGIAGNHDFVFQLGWQPRDLPWTYLEDSSTEIDGLVVHGSPWSNRYGSWAFMDDEEGLNRRWQGIPDRCDILVVHGPPFGLGDLVDRNERVGSWSLRARLGFVRPKLTVCGHIHEAHGVFEHRGGLVANVCRMDLSYSPTRPPMIFDLVDGVVRRVEER